MPETKATLWTIGTGHRAFADLVEQLQRESIEALVDVRSYPKSHLPHFCRAELELALPAVGIAYAWLGDDLGGLRDGGYRRHMGTDRFTSGLERLADLASRNRTAICCAEIDPDRCHRRFIADAMVARGWTVTHLVRPGEQRTHVLAPQQAGLFEDG
jgi:uncharacterized protein (DUF488 family)